MQVAKVCRTPRLPEDAMIDRIDTKLSVNLNKVALLRNQRDVGYPSVTQTARLVIASGAHGITVHPRPDERHIRRSDVHELTTLLSEPGFEHIEFNIEGNPTDDFLALIDAVRPHQVTLVPDSPDQRTSDHGWDFDSDGERLAPIVAALTAQGIRVSLFVDPLEASVRGAHETGAARIELYTEPYAAAFARGDYDAVLADYSRCAMTADALGMGVNAGHDLTLENTRVLRDAIDNLAEVSIGHAITSDALIMGFPAAVQAYLDALS
jgi:pyridoxine 5-phosphate synthase